MLNSRIWGFRPSKATRCSVKAKYGRPTEQHFADSLSHAKFPLIGEEGLLIANKIPSSVKFAVLARSGDTIHDPKMSYQNIGVILARQLFPSLMNGPGWRAIKNSKFVMCRYLVGFATTRHC